MKIKLKNTPLTLKLSATVLALSVLAGCQSSNEEDHHAKDNSAAHHDEMSKDDQKGDQEEGHHGDEADDGHHDKEDGASIGEAGIKSNVSKTVSVVMNDQMKFEPASIEVKEGETIQFDLTNSGVLTHEMVIGEIEELVSHGEMMKKFPGMEHEESNMLTLDGGASGELIWKFTKAGTVNFACLQAGHYDAGMKGSVTVN